jgi:predicted MFS family arabinose efflux permease
VVLGLGESLLITGALAWPIARVGPQHSGKVMVWIGIAMYGAIAVGAPLGSLLAGAYGFASVAVVVIVLPLIGIAWAARLPAVAIAASARLGFWRIVGKIFGLGSGLVFATFGFGALAAFVSLYFASRGWAGGSLALTAFGVGYVGSRLLFGGLPDRYGGAAMAAASLAVEGLGQLLIWFAPTPEVASFGALLTGIGYSLCFPAIGVEVVRRVPPASRGSAMGAYVAFFDIGIGTAGPITGMVASIYGYSAAFLTGGLAGIAGACFVAMIAVMGRKTAT